MAKTTDEYYNVFVVDAGRAYRVAFHRSGKPMIVCRKRKGDGRLAETALPIAGPRAQQIITLARKKTAP